MIIEEKGYWITENVFSSEECHEILRRFEGFEKRGKAGARNLMTYPFIRQLANDRRLLSICENLTSKKLIPYKAILFEKTGKANWLVTFHQDTALPIRGTIVDEGWGPESIKQGVRFTHAPTWALSKILALRVQLDDSTSLNGPLRVIPGTHRERLLTDNMFAEAVKSAEPVECLTNRGGVIAMRPLVLHASSKSLTDLPRRVLHIEYAESLALAPEIRLAIA